MTDDPKSTEQGESAPMNESSEKPTEGAAEKPEETIALPQADFSAHVYTLAMQALIFLGKQPNPESGKYERKIEVAKYQIDTLEVLQEKTRGNLTDDETKLLDSLLHQCRMAFVDEDAKKD
jgi:hypothetical protein